MSKVVVAYIAAGLGLFGALFASFAMSGLARPVLPAQDEAAELALAAESPAKPEPLPGTFVPPVLEPGRAYRVSHDTPIYRDPADSADDAQAVPAGGMFTFVRTLDSPPGFWIEISAYDGKRDRTMYLNGIDLRWKVLTPMYSPAERAIEQREMFKRLIKDKGLLRRPPPVKEAPPPEPEPQEFAQWWASTAESLGGASTANVIVSGVAAGITTLLTLGAIGLLSLFRGQSTWARPMMHTRDGEVIDVDNPYTLSPAEDSSNEAGEDTDRRRA